MFIFGVGVVTFFGRYIGDVVVGEDSKTVATKSKISIKIREFIHKKFTKCQLSKFYTIKFFHFWTSKTIKFPRNKKKIHLKNNKKERLEAPLWHYVKATFTICYVLSPIFTSDLSKVVEKHEKLEEIPFPFNVKWDENTNPFSINKIIFIKCNFQ